jgi:SAM-dependent methyltransferase
MFIEQANFVFEVKEVEKSRYNFITGNIFDIDFLEFGSFDIVLCLGLLYHVKDPIFLLEKISKANNDILVIDTRVSNIPGSRLEFLLDYEGVDSYVDSKLVMQPTKRAVFDLVKSFGYSVAMLRPMFTDYDGVWDYRWERRAFLCAKKTNLAKLPPELTEDINSLRERALDLLRMMYDTFRILKNRS